MASEPVHKIESEMTSEPEKEDSSEYMERAGTEIES